MAELLCMIYIFLLAFDGRTLAQTEEDWNELEEARNVNQSVIKEIGSGQQRSFIQCVNADCTPVKSEDNMRLPEDCEDLRVRGQTLNQIYNIYPMALNGLSIMVSCDMSTDAGGWTVFQRRNAKFKPRLHFARGWDSYKHGFGNPDQEFWLGLDNIRAIISSKPYVLRIDLSDFDGNKRYAEYDSFSIDPENSSYALNVGDYSGTAGDGMTEHNGMKFSTKDRDNDNNADKHCAEVYKGGWWFFSDCYRSHLNGLPYEGFTKPNYDGIEWETLNWKGFDYSFKLTEMKVRANKNPSTT